MKAYPQKTFALLVVILMLGFLPADRAQADGQFHFIVGYVHDTAGNPIVGLDVIGGKLTEVNVTSPTGIQQLSQHKKRDVSEDVIAWVEKKVHAMSPHIASLAP